MLAAGRYRLRRRLGQGGMAEVFEGVAEGGEGFRRRVAIKRILPELSTDVSCARMFLDEARIASHLHHAGIVGVLDFGTADGVPFQVLEFVDGCDLERLCRRALGSADRLSPGLAIHVALQVAHALDHAHRAQDEDGRPLGIVHRDVSPSNVLLSWDGDVKLSDFGIALAANRVERTQGQGAKGKLDYMAPEQALQGTVDQRADVFALGCMVHALVTGSSPVQDLTSFTRMAMGEELQLSEALSPALATVVARAVRRAPEQRYGSAADMAGALSDIIGEALPGDGRAVLRSWLANHRGDGPSPDRPGVLDGLLDVQLLLQTEGAEGRSFTLRGPDGRAPVAVATPTPGGTPPWSESPGDRSAQASAAIRGPVARRWWLVLLGGASLLAVLFAWSNGVWTPSGAPEASRPPPVPELPAAPVAPLLPAVDAALPGSAAPAGQPGPGASPVEDRSADLEPPAFVAAPAPKRGRPGEARRVERARSRPSPPAAVPEDTSTLTEASRRRSVEPSDVPSTPSPSAVQASPGFLRVGGAGAHRMEIRVGDRSVGFAPRLLELPAGAHDLQLLGADGRVVAQRRVSISSRHTRSSPARWIVRE